MYRVEVIRHRLRKVIVIKFHELDHVSLMKMRALRAQNVRFYDAEINSLYKQCINFRAFRTIEQLGGIE